MWSDAPQDPNHDSHYCRCRVGCRQVSPLVADRCGPARRAPTECLWPVPVFPLSLLPDNALVQGRSSKQTVEPVCATADPALDYRGLAIVVVIVGTRPVRREAVTYVSGTFCNLCVRVGPLERWQARQDSNLGPSA